MDSFQWKPVFKRERDSFRVSRDTSSQLHHSSTEFQTLPLSLDSLSSSHSQSFFLLPRCRVFIPSRVIYFANVQLVFFTQSQSHKLFEISLITNSNLFFVLAHPPSHLSLTFILSLSLSRSTDSLQVSRNPKSHGNWDHCFNELLTSQIRFSQKNFLHTKLNLKWLLIWSMTKKVENRIKLVPFEGC